MEHPGQPIKPYFLQSILKPLTVTAMCVMLAGCFGGGGDDDDDAPPDTDGDTIVNSVDNCPSDANTNQLDTDDDDQGNVCDTDDDGDGDLDNADNCPLNINADQLNTDADSQGDVCDADDDNDGDLDNADNCQLVSNADQADGDLDGAGDACDPIEVGGGGIKGPLVNATVTVYALNPGVNISKGAPLDTGETNAQAQMTGIEVPGDAEPPFLLEFTADGDTTDLVTGQAPVITVMRTVLTESMLSGGEPIYATPLTTMAVDLAIKNADYDGDENNDGDLNDAGDKKIWGDRDGDDAIDTGLGNGTTTLAEFESALPVAATQVKSTVGFGMGEDIDIFEASPVLDATTTDEDEQEQAASYRAAVEAVTAIVFQLNEATGTGNSDAVLDVLTADLADGEIDGEVDGEVSEIYGEGESGADAAQAAVQLLSQDPATLPIPNDPQNRTVGEMKQIVADERADMGNNDVDVEIDTEEEVELKPAEADPDLDDDGLPNDQDVFPNDPDEQRDFDKDGLGDNADQDDDNDGVSDDDDGFSFDRTETMDTDNDGIGNNADTNDDGDSAPDASDDFPLDSTRQNATDQDNDGWPAGQDLDDNSNANPGTTFVDTDGDGLADSGGLTPDSDDDNDGVPDTNDAFRTDTRYQRDMDGDGVADNDLAEADIDGDGVPNSADPFPRNPFETQDTDRDGTGNNTDDDDDGDSVSDALEEQNDTDPLKRDTDGDGVLDNVDEAPRNPAVQFDSDKDGDDNRYDNCPLAYNPDQTNSDDDERGDACDRDDDNDEVNDELDAFPLDDEESVDTDGDGIGNSEDGDDDGDSISDDTDPSPQMPDAATDTDGDDSPDVVDEDDDNDGEPDATDDFPLNDDESDDTDGDRIGDNADTDDDNDGLSDSVDPYQESRDGDGDGRNDAQDNCPSNANGEQRDSDGDRQGDVCDTDDDNDGVPESEGDNCPLIPNAGQQNNDGDDFGNACDSDLDGDGFANHNDNCPFMENDQADENGNGIGDACDADEDRDGRIDPLDNCPLVPNSNQLNFDRDGQGDDCDDDDDNDGLSDEAETETQTDPLDADSDDDRVPDGLDLFPMNGDESSDSDEDGVGNNADNCPFVSNPPVDGVQADVDDDGRGDVCDTVPTLSSFYLNDHLHQTTHPSTGLLASEICPEVMDAETLTRVTHWQQDGAMVRIAMPDPLELSLNFGAPGTVNRSGAVAVTMENTYEGEEGRSVHMTLNFSGQLDAEGVITGTATSAWIIRNSEGTEVASCGETSAEIFTPMPAMAASDLLDGGPDVGFVMMKGRKEYSEEVMMELPTFVYELIDNTDATEYVYDLFDSIWEERAEEPETRMTLGASGWVEITEPHVVSAIGDTALVSQRDATGTLHGNWEVEAFASAIVDKPMEGLVPRPWSQYGITTPTDFASETAKALGLQITLQEDYLEVRCHADEHPESPFADLDCKNGLVASMTEEGVTTLASSLSDVIHAPDAVMQHSWQGIRVGGMERESRRVDVYAFLRGANNSGAEGSSGETLYYMVARRSDGSEEVPELMTEFANGSWTVIDANGDNSHLMIAFSFAQDVLQMVNTEFDDLGSVIVAVIPDSSDSQDYLRVGSKLVAGTVFRQGSLNDPGLTEVKEALDYYPNIDGDDDTDASDLDEDNDEVSDEEDAFPYNRYEQLDSDGDGEGNNRDQDDDNDGVEDYRESSQGTDPLIADTDDDGHDDGADNCPVDANPEQNPSACDDDGDGQPNHLDPCPDDETNQCGGSGHDSDGDGINDSEDSCPFDPITEHTVETCDDDGDGQPNTTDPCRYDPTNQCSSVPQDTDHDGFPDDVDAFDDIATEYRDTDGDGTGDNADQCDYTANLTCEDSGPVMAGAYLLSWTEDPNATQETMNDAGDACVPSDEPQGVMPIQVAQFGNQVVIFEDGDKLMGFGLIGSDGVFTINGGHTDDFSGVMESLELTGSLSGSSFSGTFESTETSANQSVSCSSSGTFNAVAGAAVNEETEFTNGISWFEFDYAMNQSGPSIPSIEYGNIGTTLEQQFRFNMETGTWANVTSESFGREHFLTDAGLVAANDLVIVTGFGANGETAHASVTEPDTNNPLSVDSFDVDLESFELTGLPLSAVMGEEIGMFVPPDTVFSSGARAYAVTLRPTSAGSVSYWCDGGWEGEEWFVDNLECDNIITIGSSDQGNGDYDPVPATTFAQVISTPAELSAEPMDQSVRNRAIWVGAGYDGASYQLQAFLESSNGDETGSTPTVRFVKTYNFTDMIEIATGSFSTGTLGGAAFVEFAVPQNVRELGYYDDEDGNVVIFVDDSESFGHVLRRGERMTNTPETGEIVFNAIARQDIVNNFALPQDGLSGAWYLEEGSPSDYNVLVFVDGEHYAIGHSLNGEPDPGLGVAVPTSAEVGTFTMGSGGEFAVNMMAESDGQGGLSSMSESATLSRDGATLTLTDGGEIPFSLISSTENPMLGAWEAGGSVLVFVDGTRYMLIHSNNDQLDTDLGTTFAAAAEHGTYTWDSGTGALSVTVIDQSDGQNGFSDLAGAATLTLVGNELTLSIVGEPEPTTFFRIGGE